MSPREVAEILCQDHKKKIVVIVGSGTNITPLGPYRENPQVVIREVAEGARESVLSEEKIAYILAVGDNIPHLAFKATLRDAERRGVGSTGEVTWRSQPTADFLRRVFDPDDLSLQHGHGNGLLSRPIMGRADRATGKSAASSPTPPSGKPSVTEGEEGDANNPETAGGSDMKRKNGESLRDFIKEKGDFSGATKSGEEIDRLFALAKKSGFKTTRATVSYTFYNVRSALAKNGGHKRGAGRRGLGQDVVIPISRGGRRRSARSGGQINGFEGALEELRAEMKRLCEENARLRKEQEPLREYLGEAQELLEEFREKVDGILNKMGGLTAHASSRKARAR